MQLSTAWKRLSQVVLGGVITRFAAVYALILLVWLLGVPKSHAESSLINLFTAPISIVACVLAFRASRDQRLPDELRRAWMFISLAYAMQNLGDLSWFYFDKILGIDPSASLANIPFVLFYPLIIAGLFSFPQGIRTRMERVKFTLDVLTVLVGGAIVIWYFAIRPAIARGTTDLLTLLPLAHPIGDILILVGVAAVLLRRSTGPGRRPLALLGAGLLAGTCANVLWAAVDQGGRYDTGGIASALWVVGYVLVLAAADLEHRGAGGLSKDEALAQIAPRFSLVPYLAVTVVFVVLVFDTLQHPRLGLLGLVGGVGALTVLLVARQFTSVRENAILLSEHATRAGEARFHALVQGSYDVIMTLTEDLRIQFASPSVERILGYDPAVLIGRPVTDFVIPADVAAVSAFLQATLQRPGATNTMEWHFRRPNGEEVRAENLTTNLIEDPRVGGLLLNARDITERHRLKEQLAHQAFHDPLTNLANRSLFHDRVSHALTRASRRHARAAIVLLDLDNFKTVNDSLGHAQGDALLVAAAGRLRTCVRASDTVARLGGDEFALLLEDGDDRAELTRFGERIAAAFQEPFMVGDRRLVVTISAGVAVADGEGTEELLRNADVAMYIAKDRGRGRYVFFERWMHDASIAKLELQADLQLALEAREFEIHYQPIFKLSTYEVIGLEALLRWTRTGRGDVPPSVFVPLLEESGQVVGVGRWVLREACRQAAHWRQTLPGYEHLSITVNLSSLQLLDASFIQDVDDALKAAALPASSLVLELTESILMQNDSALDVLRGLKGLGVRIAMDDFGTGYSSLSYLHRFPLDILKIDKSFIGAMDAEDSRAFVVQTVIALGDQLGLPTIAEGIERPDQVAMLRRLGCEGGQGFYFSGPLPPSALEPYLASQALRDNTPILIGRASTGP
ncbi:MAG: EAL domain-containing protein [Gemmatimonadota bacterium]